MKILVILSLFLGSSLFNGHKKECLELDVVILVDVSGSIAGYEEYIHKALYVFINKIEPSETGIWLSVVKFSKDGEVASHLSYDKSILIYQFDRIISDGGTTNMADGMYSSVNELVENGRKGVKKVIIVLSDGAVDNSTETQLVAEQLKMSNVTICSVLILSNTIDKELMKAISSNCYIESRFEDLPEQIEKLDLCL